MVANQQDVQEIASLAAALTREVGKLLNIVEGLEFRIATLERKAKLDVQYPREA